MSLAKLSKRDPFSSGIGLFSKKEGASLVASGCPHVHSSILGQKDGLVSLTLSSMKSQVPAVYPWEIGPNTQQLFLKSSKARKKLIEEVLLGFNIKQSSSAGDKIWTALEELLTNSIFHAYHDTNGKEKYHRKDAVELLPQETISVKFHRGSNGLFLSVQDFGQGLDFAKVSANFKRCYESSDISQIETKDGGAGLGLYVVFELATHIKIVSQPGFGTMTSCWFASPSSFDPDYFSFNYFQGALKP